MIIMTNYTLLKNNSVYYAVSEAIPLCPDCHSRLTIRDSRWRKVIMEDGNKRLFSLRRLKCENCQKLHIELPDLMMPYKHYEKKVIQETAEGNCPDCPADNSTIRRWQHEIKL